MARTCDPRLLRLLSPAGRSRRDESGIVGVNLVLVISFALYAVIMLSWTTLSARQIDNHVKVIITEVGPGSNVSRLDETQKLNTIGKTAEDILAAARPLSGQAQRVIELTASIDSTASAIFANANEINATANSINNTGAALRPVVQNIHGDTSDNNMTGGVDLINRQAAAAAPVVSDISIDLERISGAFGKAGNGAHQPLNTVHAHVNSIDCSLNVGQGQGLLGLVLNLGGALLGPPPDPSCDLT